MCPSCVGGERVEIRIIEGEGEGRFCIVECVRYVKEWGMDVYSIDGKAPPLLLRFGKDLYILQVGNM